MGSTHPLPIKLWVEHGYSIIPTGIPILYSFIIIFSCHMSTHTYYWVKIIQVFKSNLLLINVNLWIVCALIYLSIGYPSGIGMGKVLEACSLFPCPSPHSEPLESIDLLPKPPKVEPVVIDIRLNFSNHEHGYVNNNEGGLFGWTNPSHWYAMRHYDG
jgi:hypothetical protein